jgi:hypothetical protein
MSPTSPQLEWLKMSLPLATWYAAGNRDQAHVGQVYARISHNRRIKDPQWGVRLMTLRPWHRR